MHYRGTLASDGSKFDASYDRGKPLAFTLGQGQVIKGFVASLIDNCIRYLTDKRVRNRWDDGLLDMCIGEKRKLTIPPKDGYGDRAMGPIPAGSTLSKFTKSSDVALC